MVDDESDFSTAGRAEGPELMSEAELLASSALVHQLTHAAPYAVVLLNDCRQIVYENQHFKHLLSSWGIHVLGRRPGEVLGCENALLADGGCGCSEKCSECGALVSILDAQRHQRGAMRECLINTERGVALEFKVWAVSCPFLGKEYTLLNLWDISHEKRREALERTFFHDVNNILTGINGYLSLVKDSELPPEVSKTIETVKLSSQELTEEIATHRKLLQAEDGKLCVSRDQTVYSQAFLDQLLRLASRIWPGRSFCKKPGETLRIQTDRSLLFRVLYNMMKNAVEANSPESEIWVGCSRQGDRAEFHVQSQSFIPTKVQRRLFERSFSTKGRGRGIGTYSMKLFGEKYLNGRVWFDSSEELGTWFYISVPYETDAV